MFKRKILLCALIPFALAGCKPKENKTREVVDDPVVDVLPDITPEQAQEVEPSKVPALVYSKLASYKSYKAVTSGTTVAKLWGIPVNQTIDVTVLKSDFSYLRNESKGTVNTVHEAYYHDSKAVYRDKESADFTVKTLDEYLQIYGTYPFDKGVEGYLINNDAVKSVTKGESSDSNLVYNLEFDPEKSTNNVKIQMQKFGGLDEYPVFSLIEMKLTVTTDFTLVKLDLHSKYTAKKVMNTDCEQNYTVSYSNYNETLEIPNLESVKALFN